MIVAIKITNYRSIKSMPAPLTLDRFHVLVGPNASGKSTFLDAIDLVRDCLAHGPGPAVEKRAPSFSDLTWMRQGGVIEISLYMEMENLPQKQADSLLHYHLAIKQDPQAGVCIHEELLRQLYKPHLKDDFELKPTVQAKRLLGKTAKGSDFYRREQGNYTDSFVFGMDRPSLSLTPPDEKRYPSGNAIKNFLLNGIRYLQLNSRAMRDPCPATRSQELDLDGTNLARVVGRLMMASLHGDPGQFPLKRWIEHLRYALPELKSIGWGRRTPDNAEYITLNYDGGLKCPSWLISDGTLRMLALTLPAFLEPEDGIYMVEEPENGVHPKALEIIISALSAIPRAQMLVATHSPFVVQQAGRESLLCFSRTEGEGTTICKGANHPQLREWDGSPDLATIFSAGVLG